MSLSLVSLVEKALAPLHGRPDASTFVEISEGRFELLVTPNTGPCFWCEEWTPVIDINFEARLCLRCHDEAWDEFFRAERRLSNARVDASDLLR